MADAPDPRGRPDRGAHRAVALAPRGRTHATECARGLPAVFDTSRKPWIAVDAAAADAVVTVVERCPSGALTYERAEGPAEVPAVPTRIEREAGGPLHVRGDLAIATADGELRLRRATLCACGKSANAPFCDLSHRED